MPRSISPTMPRGRRDAADTPRRSRPIGSAGLVICLLLGGCYATTATVEPLSPPEPFPYGAAALETIEVQVFRDGPVLELVNLTPRGFGPFVLWLNERYAAVVPGLDAGGAIRIDARLFVDEYGEGFRGGGLLAPYLPDPVVKAEIETADGLIALQVVPPPDR